MKADKEIQDIYKKSCQSDLEHYTELCALGIDMIQPDMPHLRDFETY